MQSSGQVMSIISWLLSLHKLGHQSSQLESNLRRKLLKLYGHAYMYMQECT